MIGVAPKTIDRNGTDMYKKSGWYFSNGSAILYSQFPPGYYDQPYQPSYFGKLGAGTIIRMIVDGPSKQISFAINDDPPKIAYSNLTFNESVVPCILMFDNGNSISLID